MAKMRIKPNARVTIIGSTGDGKTTLALWIMAQMVKFSPKHDQVIINPGAEEKLYKLFGQPSESINTKWPKCQHVVPFVTQNKKDYDEIFWPIVDHGNTITYIDEVFVVADGSSYSLGYQYLYQAGRRRGDGVIAVSQRPVDIPKITLQMADHLFICDVSGDDLTYLEKKIVRQPLTALMNQRKQYEYIWYSRHTKELKVVKIPS